MDLDGRFYKLVDDFTGRIPHAPSLRRARSPRVRGDWTFGDDVAVIGDVELADEGEPQTVPDQPTRGVAWRAPSRWP